LWTGTDERGPDDSPRSPSTCRHKSTGSQVRIQLRQHRHFRQPPRWGWTIRVVGRVAGGRRRRRPPARRPAWAARPVTPRCRCAGMRPPPTAARHNLRQGVTGDGKRRRDARTSGGCKRGSAHVSSARTPASPTASLLVQGARGERRGESGRATRPGAPPIAPHASWATPGYENGSTQPNQGLPRRRMEAPPGERPTREAGTRGWTATAYPTTPSTSSSPSLEHSAASWASGAQRHRRDSGTTPTTLQVQGAQP